MPANRRLAPAAALGLLAAMMPNISLANDSACSDVQLGPLINGIYRLQPGIHDLPPNCVFSGQLNISHSDTVLDCRGSVFDGSDVQSSGNSKRSDAIGLTIYAKEGPTSNVVVRNCTFRNFSKIGINITSGFTPGALQFEPNRYVHDVLIDRVRIEKSGVGLYMRPRGANITIKNSTFDSNEDVAVYIELNNGAQLIENQFVRNGWKYGRRSREAVAVDASQDSQLRLNTFRDNGLGGIFLYRNCGEKRGFNRWQQSSRNKIFENQFLREDIGIWIASRQSVDLSRLDCADPPMEATRRYFEDYANHNIIKGNIFCTVQTPVRIEGDYNVVTDSLFFNASPPYIDIPIGKRAELLGRPPAGNKTYGNQARSGTCPSVTEP